MGADGVMDWQVEVSAILRGTPELEFSLRRDLLFARHGFAMPFPLREDFLDHLEESLHLPIWVQWDSWQKLLSGPSELLEGFWERENELICVRGDLVHWLTIEGQPRAVQQMGNGRYSIGLGDGTSCAAWLEDGLLRWDDGDVWHRPAASRLAAVTRSLEPWPLCVLLRSLADSRDFSASVLENRYVHLRRHPMSEFGQLAESYAHLLKLVPVDVGLRERFLTAVAQLPRLVEQRRRRYTPELIRQNFHVLHVGHSYLHLHSAVLPDGEQAIMGFLQRCTSMDLFRRVLCNDIAQLHPEDLLEDLFTMPPSSLAQLLPLAHFDAVVIRNCPAKLSTLAFQNFASMLRDGGVLIAFPAYLDEHAEVPQSLNSCWVEPPASEEGALLFGDLNGAVWKIGLLLPARPLDSNFFKCLLESETKNFLNTREAQSVTLQSPSQPSSKQSKQKEREHGSNWQATSNPLKEVNSMISDDWLLKNLLRDITWKIASVFMSPLSVLWEALLRVAGGSDFSEVVEQFRAFVRSLEVLKSGRRRSLYQLAAVAASHGLRNDCYHLLVHGLGRYRTSHSQQSVLDILTQLDSSLLCRVSSSLQRLRQAVDSADGGAALSNSAEELGRLACNPLLSEESRSALRSHSLFASLMRKGGEPQEQLRMLSAGCKEASPLAAAQLAEQSGPLSAALLHMLPLPRAVFGVFRDLQALCTLLSGVARSEAISFEISFALLAPASEASDELRIRTERFLRLGKYRGGTVAACRRARIHLLPFAADAFFNVLLPLLRWNFRVTAFLWPLAWRGAR
eukprot:s5740_g3.t1